MVKSMRYTTRLNPTVNGYLHVGHAYLALVNYWEAKNTKGKFIIRFDDEQPYWNQIAKSDTKAIKTQMLKDLQFLDILPDEIDSEATPATPWEKVYDLLIDNAKVDDLLPMPEAYESLYQVENIGSQTSLYPYNPHFTLAKVMRDYIERVNLLIRGEDLISEYSLYSYFCDVLRIPNPRHVYLPRLTLADGNEISDVSKTKGNLSIQSLIQAGLTKDDILIRLSQACLKNPDSGWFISNVKDHPVWDMHLLGHGNSQNTTNKKYADFPKGWKINSHAALGFVAGGDIDCRVCGSKKSSLFQSASAPDGAELFICDNCFSQIKETY